MNDMEKTIYVVNELWFNENMSPSTETEVVDVLDTLEEATECMEKSLNNSVEELIDGKDKSKLKYETGDKWSMFTLPDDSVWCVTFLTIIKKDDNGKTIEKIITYK